MDSQKNKGGRPSMKEKEKRTYQIKVTFNEEEYAAMTKQVNKTSFRVAEYIRQVVLKKEIKPNYTKEEQAHLVFLDKAKKIVGFMRTTNYKNLSEGEQKKYLDYMANGIDKIIKSIL